MAGITINKVDNRSFLKIGSEQIEVSDYNVKSTASGVTELNVTIRGTSNVFEMSANLKEQMKLIP